MAKESTEFEVSVDCATKGHNTVVGKDEPDWDSVAVCPICIKLKAKLVTLEKLCEDITKRNVALNDRFSPSLKRRGNRDGT